MLIVSDSSPASSTLRCHMNTVTVSTAWSQVLKLVTHLRCSVQLLTVPLLAVQGPAFHSCCRLSISTLPTLTSNSAKHKLLQQGRRVLQPCTAHAGLEVPAHACMPQGVGKVTECVQMCGKGCWGQGPAGARVSLCWEVENVRGVDRPRCPSLLRPPADTAAALPRSSPEQPPSAAQVTGCPAVL